MAIIKMKAGVVTDEEMSTGPFKFVPPGKTYSVTVEVARKFGNYAGILFRYLQKQMKNASYERAGRKWIDSLSYASIHNDLPIFADVKAIKRAAKLLTDGKMVFAESTGALLEPNHVTGRKRDIATWWWVGDAELATASFRADDAMAQGKKFKDRDAATRGIAKALILQYIRMQPVIEDGYCQLVTVEMAKDLPIHDRTIQRHLKDLLKDKILAAHPSKVKLYKIA
jgi:hypothetical protein